MPYFHSSDWPRRFSRTASRRSQPRVAKEQPAREPLEPHRVLDGEAEVPQLDLRVRAGQGDRARDRAAVVVLLDEAPGAGLAVGKRRS